MFDFLGLLFGNYEHKLQQIVPDKERRAIQKTSEVLLWVVADKGNGILHIPISKLDTEIYKSVVPSQLEASYYDHTRTLINKKTSEVAPYCGIILR